MNSLIKVCLEGILLVFMNSVTNCLEGIFLLFMNFVTNPCLEGILLIHEGLTTAQAFAPTPSQVNMAAPWTSTLELAMGGVLRLRAIFVMVSLNSAASAMCSFIFFLYSLRALASTLVPM